MKHRLLFLFVFILFGGPVFAQHSTVESEKWISEDLGHLYFNGGKVYFNFDGFDKHKNGYKIERDTLKIIDTYSSSADDFKQQHVDVSKFIINYFDGKKLVIKAVNENAVKLAGRTPQEFKNYKASFDNSIKFSKLRFLSSTCYGECPQLAINIWADGTYRLKGGEFADPYKGDYAGKLTAAQLDSLNYLLKRSELKKMYNWKQGNQVVDAPNYYFDIDFVNSKDKLTITTDEPPLNITELVAFLIQSYKKVKLVPFKEAGN
ncbi:DUF6438 domain-containing protein [Mucilaginibacter celer]|uniref:DUF6438 domain-containing protein n=1 Tax=Mucilaginibacter celer TaxID=2305508 RepID=A0A494VWV9_9SPHI|nr:DUF6438 domain-containing protein [Mucilaginibacter celer]AYL95953.1 hypothetical protein HYN43_011930 [Mucilaginibacter celer]